MIRKINGIQIFESSRLPEFMDFQIRTLKQKRWHVRSRTNYLQRINKKWRKRFGVKSSPHFVYLEGKGVFAHPNTVKRLIDAMDKSETINCGNLQPFIGTPTEPPFLAERLDVYQTRTHEYAKPFGVRAVVGLTIDGA